MGIYLQFSKCVLCYSQIDRLQTLVVSRAEGVAVADTSNVSQDKMLSQHKQLGHVHVMDLPCVGDLLMSHFSDVCILLRWTTPPPMHPDSSHSGAVIQGYRVFVNGVAEGTVRSFRLSPSVERHVKYMSHMSSACKVHVTHAQNMLRYTVCGRSHQQKQTNKQTSQFWTWLTSTGNSQHYGKPHGSLVVFN